MSVNLAGVCILGAALGEGRIYGRDRARVSSRVPQCLPPPELTCRGGGP